ncbi:uncharacterized protein PHACADRAFT_247603 [Phanerochaete carnosa HHB-10118-sp]|uniref:Uncharacterized protein n=1 Tax=Phanerochaete carnosa (strain HHB-10118-sp) TaxID=650164 RepID=K5XDQ6_PHACS|nr:uncharacterized protein PHACADRAFT_247603 [Phanerochaete carnosa HHB-10118-sp]EKM61167.1 hypothetical protein PHACADRAFT_247603 [Phanerochaete carnosa HHB-10118-sp]
MPPVLALLAQTVLLPLIWLSGLELPSPTSIASPANDPSVPVPLRIEGEHCTVFEGIIPTTGHNISTPSSNGSHHCDGTNNKAHNVSGPTATTALADAVEKESLLFDAVFDTKFDDFFITRVGDGVNTSTQNWRLYVDFVASNVGGCQEQVSANRQVLWALQRSDVHTLLHLEGPHTASHGVPVVLTVTNGSTRNPISGASVSNLFQPTNASGQVTVTFEEKRSVTLKATKEGTVRSNALTILVT